MTRSRLWLVLLAVAVAGFALGRFSGSWKEVAVTLKSPAGNKSSLPAPPHDAAVSAADSSNILVEFPADAAIVSVNALTVAGRARRSGGDVSITFKDAAGSVLATATLPLEGAAQEEFGRFSAALTFSSASPGVGTVEFVQSASSESAPMAPVVRRVLISSTIDQAPGTTEVSDTKEVAPSAEGLKVKVYFHNGELGPADDCSLVFPVERVVRDGYDATGMKDALVELLSGPSAEEKSIGYTSAIPDGAALKDVSTDAKGVTIADFAASLERGVAGSCRVQAIRAQIETTLRQFPATRDVIVSVEGRIDDALQP